MPQALRTQMALVLMLGVFLVPIGMSSLRGLTHVLTCDQTDTKVFTLQSEGDETIDTGSQVIERDAAGEVEDPKVCGLDVSIRVGEAEGDNRQLVLDITNPTEDNWRGTIELEVDSTSVPIAIGEIDAGTTATKTIDLRVDSEELSGKLLIGP